MKVVQIVNGVVAWVTNFKTVAETVGKYPRTCLFVSAPDYVFEKWTYVTKDEEGKPITGDARFVKPIPPEGYIYDDYTGKFLKEEDLPVILAKAHSEKQDENKVAFAKFLAEHPLTWTDGKVYGVTLEDQSEISLNLTQYQMQVSAGIENPVLEWHASKEACTPWSFENLTALALAISAYIYPWFQKMNEYKAQIYACQSKADVDAIEIVYKTEEEIAAEVAAAEAANAEA